MIPKPFFKSKHLKMLAKIKTLNFSGLCKEAGLKTGTVRTRQYSGYDPTNWQAIQLQEALRKHIRQCERVLDEL